MKCQHKPGILTDLSLGRGGEVMEENITSCQKCQSNYATPSNVLLPYYTAFMRQLLCEVDQHTVFITLSTVERLTLFNNVPAWNVPTIIFYFCVI